MSVLTDLRELARHIDPQFHFSLNELPGVVSALVVKLEQGDALAKAIEEGQQRQQELHPAEIAGNEVSTSVAHLIEPPQEGTTDQQGGVSQARYNALADEVTELRASLDRLAGHIPAAEPSMPPPPDRATSSPGVDAAAAEPPDAIPATEAAPASSNQGTTSTPSAREQQLQAEVDQLRAEAEQRAAIARATGEHPVAVQPTDTPPADTPAEDV